MPSEVKGDSAGPVGPGSQSALRRNNVRRVLATLGANGPQTQAQLARRTGLSAGTVASIVRDLEAKGRLALERTTSSGRRALAIKLVDTGQVAAGVDFGRRHVRIILATPDHRILSEHVRELPLGHDAEAGVAAAAELFDEALAANSRTREQVLGAGVGIPGPVDPSTGLIGSGAILPEWRGIAIAPRVAEALRVPVYILNDANQGALAHLGWGEESPAADFAFVKVGTGIGTGLVLDGELYSGSAGLAGEIGHTIVHEQGLMCRCGNRGCLETVASTSAMLGALSAAPDAPRTTDELIASALSGDIATRRVVEDAGASIGKVLGQVCSLINPQLILIGGPLSALGDLLLEPISHSLGRHTVPDLAQATQVRMSDLGDSAEALGGVVSVLSHTDAEDLFSPLTAGHP